MGHMNQPSFHAGWASIDAIRPSLSAMTPSACRDSPQRVTDTLQVGETDNLTDGHRGVDLPDDAGDPF